MNEKYFLNEDLFYLDKSLYKVSNDKNIRLNRKNWFSSMKNYGWEKLKLNWRKILENNFFSVLECGADGDCLFHVVSEALNMELIYNYEIPNYDIANVRSLAASQINDDNFVIILESYKAELECGEFFGDWNPNTITCINDLQVEILKSGNNFWGDHILIQLLSEKLSINFIILNDESHNITSMCNDLKYDKTIIIYYLDNLHFQLVGYFNGKIMQTVFKNSELPLGLLKKYQEDTKSN
tara:strand:- start:805 stop:1521 length:717 start_codon:yes stop_codon:yes gene_type:complete